MSKQTQNSALVPVNQNSEIVKSSITSSYLGLDEKLRDADGYECTIPKVFTQVRVNCSDGKGWFVEKPFSKNDDEIIRGKEVESVPVHYRLVRLNKGQNYVNHLFIEIFMLPVNGELRKIFVSKEDGDLVLKEHDLRLTTFLISAETSGSEDKPKQLNKTHDNFQSLITSSTLKNSLLWGKLSHEERMAIANPNDWLKATGPASIFNQVLKISFNKEKTDKFTYYSVNFATRAINPSVELEVKALEFSSFIREDFANNGVLRCRNSNHEKDQTYIDALGQEILAYSGENMALIEGEIEEIKSLPPSDF